MSVCFMIQEATDCRQARLAFVHQLHYHYEEPIQNKLVVYNVSSSKTPALQVAKTEEVMNRLADFRSGGTRAISASAVNTYLDCPLKFYFSVVEGIREEEEVSETIEVMFLEVSCIR